MWELKLYFLIFTHPPEDYKEKKKKKKNVIAVSSARARQQPGSCRSVLSERGCKVAHAPVMDGPVPVRTVVPVSNAVGRQQPSSFHRMWRKGCTYTHVPARITEFTGCYICLVLTVIYCTRLNLNICVSRFGSYCTPCFIHLPFCGMPVLLKLIFILFVTSYAVYRS